jgi:UDP-glucose:glycoprotein glucosyltransferase
LLKTGEAFDSPAEEVLPFDHLYRGANKGRCVIVYADLNYEDFGMCLAFLFDLGTWHYTIMSDATVCYILRFLPPKQTGETSPLLLSGYGVQLRIKNQEYKVTDDRLIVQDDDSDGESDDQEGYVDPEFDAETPVIGKMEEERDWADVGVKTALHILEAEDQLASLQHLSQNFPRYQRLIFEKDVKGVDEYKRQMSAIQSSIPPTKSVLMINGMSIDEENFNLFSLFKNIKEESRLVQRLVDLDIPMNVARKLMIPSGDREKGIKGSLFDMRDDSVVWWNNIEKDRRYKNWPISMREVCLPV